LLPFLGHLVQRGGGEIGVYAGRAGFVRQTPEKQDTKLMPITFPNVNRFSDFFHYKFFFKYSTYPKYVATLPCEI